jgi:hypothetical protein
VPLAFSIVNRFCMGERALNGPKWRYPARSGRWRTQATAVPPRCTSWIWPVEHGLALLPIRPHRLIVVRASLSQAGSQSLDRRMSAASYNVTADDAKERRAINKHLLAFSRVISELAQAHRRGP